VSRAQTDELRRLLREGPLDLGGDLTAQWPLLEQLLTSHPLPAGVETRGHDLGGVPVVEVAPSSAATDGVVLFLHGGAFALGSAAGAAGMLAEVVGRTGVLGVSVEYRLAPEHPFPAGLDDAVTAYRSLLASGVPADRIVVAGESAGGGLALALLLTLRDQGLAQPAAAFVFSPWADLTLNGATMTAKAEVDPALTRSGLQSRVDDYLDDGAAASDPLVSPVHADLRGLPPLLIQCGSAEVLLSDALRLAARAAQDDVEVTLQVTPHAPHVFQGFPGVLDEAVSALDAAAAFTRARLEQAATTPGRP